jgi:predicted ATPase
MSELSTITVKGFKSINVIENLSLGPINVVIGPNGSGKSNFIGVFAFLNALRQGRLQDYVVKAGGAEKVLHFGSKTTQTIEISISFQDGRNKYQVQLQPAGADDLRVFEEQVFYWDKGSNDRAFSKSIFGTGREAGISETAPTGILNYVQKHFDQWRLYHFHDTSASSPMKKTADVNDNRFFRTEGANLAAFLYFLKEKHAVSYNLIRRTIQRVAPFFDDFLLEPQKLNPDKIQLEWRHKNNDSYYDTSSFSDGTLRFIALATLFLQPGEYCPSVILVDEPELGLHPYAVALLASLVKQAAQKTQVIISTQSSFLLDHFTPEDVLVADRVNGGTQFTRLETEKLSLWLKDYSLGQLWEKNELCGRPRVE